LLVMISLDGLFIAIKFDRPNEQHMVGGLTSHFMIYD